jgi:hypothetical protein
MSIDFTSTEGLKNLGMDILKTTASVMAVRMSGVGDYAQNVLGASGKLSGYAVDGLTYALSNELVDYFTEGSSTLSRMDYIRYADNVVFFGAVSAASSETGAVKFAYENFRKVSPLEDEMNKNLVEGLVVSTGRVGSNMILSSPANNDVFRMIRSPVTRILGR